MNALHSQSQSHSSTDDERVETLGSLEASTPASSVESPTPGSYDTKRVGDHVEAASSDVKELPSSIGFTGKDVDSEADRFLADLNNFLPLGCLQFDAVLHESDNEECHGWTEITPAGWPSVLAGPGYALSTRSHLLKLLSVRWIRTFARGTMLRVYILPHDAGRRFVDRANKHVTSALQGLLRVINVSPKAWNHHDSIGEPQAFDPWALAEDSSLFYMFNALPSPNPAPETIRDRFTRLAARELLDPETEIRGLKTPLYPYQARSAALMVQREASPDLHLDPRLDVRYTPDGQRFYYNARDMLFLRNPRFYEQNRGGILAETMGLGKTMICLAVVLTTKGHVPRIPAPYQTPIQPRPSVGTLADMATAKINQYSLPWRLFFDRRKESHGEDLTQCERRLAQGPASYSIPVRPVRFNRKTTLPPPEVLHLCSGTIIIVPRNLVHQWKSEIQKHVVDGDDGLRVLVLDNSRMPIPSAAVLRTYDIILFSRTRFEQEIRDGSDSKGRRVSQGATLKCTCTYVGATRNRACTCLKESDIYGSPLKKLHWLRIIVDEGHDFASSSSNAVMVASKFVKAERRWVVSGTPAKDRLFGVEVDLAANDEHEHADPQKARSLALEQRKQFNKREDSFDAARSLGNLATHFLQVRPWAESDAEGKADWEDYIFRHEDHRRRTFSGFSKALPRALEALVVKTRPEDVERDITLPPLHHRVVYLDPSYYDKLTANIFIQVLRANAVTSERTDSDYLFHKNNIRARRQLITNLRQSNFAWTGFTVEDVEKSLKVCDEYLQKDNVNCSLKDVALLRESMNLARESLSSDGWKALSRTHEVGLFVDQWPKESAQAWSFGEPIDALLTGVTQVLMAQSHVNSKLDYPDPTEGLMHRGEVALAEAYASEKEKKATAHATEKDAALEEKGIPSSCLAAAPVTPKRHSRAASKGSPKKLGLKKPIAFVAGSVESTVVPEQVEQKSTSPRLKRKIQAKLDSIELPEESPLAQTSIVGTTSAKLSYLLDRVSELHATEKILIFYDGDNAAYYIAQCLESLHIKHLIYAKSLANDVRSRYIVAFDQDPTIRVLLMDIRCGALGLNVNACSRVFFLNPVNRPSIEAQAVKRAHRIGQTRPVMVETLVLRGTVEEAIFERAKKMTRNEHRETKTLEDDEKITDIIQNARVVPIADGEGEGLRQVAKLQTPQRVFARPGRGDARIRGIDADVDAEVGADGGSPMKKARAPKKETKRTIAPTDGFLPEATAALPSRPPPRKIMSLFGGPASSSAKYLG